MRTESFSERDLASRCAVNDRDAQGELYARYAARLYALCFRYVGDREEAQDLMHDSMIKAMGSFRLFSYNGEGSLYAWLRRLTVNIVIDRLRSMSKLRMVPLDTTMEWDVQDSAADEDVESIPASVLLEMVASLPSVKRAVFNMYCIDGFSHKEIAAAMNISEKGSASILAKSRAQLRETVKDYLKRYGR